MAHGPSRTPYTMPYTKASTYKEFSTATQSTSHSVPKPTSHTTPKIPALTRRHSLTRPGQALPLHSMNTHLIDSNKLLHKPYTAHTHIETPPPAATSSYFPIGSTTHTLPVICTHHTPKQLPPYPTTQSITNNPTPPNRNSTYISSPTREP